MAEDINATNKDDIVYNLLKGVIASTPGIGSVAAEVFSMVVTPPIERRRAEWMNEIADRLRELEEQELVDFAKLAEDDRFIDVIVQSTAHAIKTSIAEKKIAFRNAVLNAAKGEAPDITLCHIFLNQLDNFTELHIRVLHFIDNPRDWFTGVGRTPPSYMAGSLDSLVKDAFPDLRSQDALLTLVWNDLRNTGFHTTSDLKTMMSGDGVLANRTTKLGREFLNFIKSQT